MAIIYRTAGVWGAGKGSNLTAVELDNNFFDHESRIDAMEDHPPLAIEIDSFETVGNLLYVHMTDHTVKGPYILPTASMRLTNPPTGLWLPGHVYTTLDLFNINGSTYLVAFPHTSAGSFDAGANDGLGHNYYSLLFTNPADVIPAGGSIGQFLTKVDGHDFHTQWSTEFRRIAVFISGAPSASERLIRYETPEILTFPAGLLGSRASAATEPFAAVSYNIRHNGSSIGSVDFLASPTFEASFTFASDVTFAVGDIFELYAPATPDNRHSDLSFTFQAHL